MLANFRIIFLVIAVFCARLVLAQVTVDINPSQLNINENLTISVYINNADLYEVSEFPEIQGLKKTNRSIKHGQTLQNGKKVSQHIVSQIYLAEKKGKFPVLAFYLTVNQKQIYVESNIIEVLDPNYVAPVEKVEEVDLLLELSKNKVFVGEGVNVKLGFYLSDNTNTQWQFASNISSQIEEIAKKIKPLDCIESRSNISNITPVKVNIKGKSYAYYLLFGAVYYPLSDKQLVFPSVQLSMQKNINNQAKSTILSTKAKMVKVLKLPDHPLKDKVTVGNFKLEERINNPKQYTGNSFDYKFIVSGTGNLTGLNLETIDKNTHFEFYPENPKIFKGNGQIEGTKVFEYKIIPKDSGTYSLSSLFSVIYFNSDKQRYDTLKSEKTIKVSGQKINQGNELSTDIYANIENLKTDSKDFHFREYAKIISNFIWVCLLISFLYILKYKNNE